MTNVKVSVAVVGNYQGLPLAGTSKAFDGKLDGWLSRALDLGMIGCGLGQLFPIHVHRRRDDAFHINADTILLAGMGEPGHFAADDLRYLMSNITVAVKSMGAEPMSISLLGTRRSELPIDRAVRSFAEGILDGHRRFQAIAEVLTRRREAFLELAEQKLTISLVDRDEDRANSIYEALLALQREYEALAAANPKRTEPTLRLEIGRGGKVHADDLADSSGVDADPDVPVTVLQITRSDGNAAVPEGNASETAFCTDVFQFSALTDVAAISVRDVEVNSYVVRELPDRMINAPARGLRDEFCKFFGNYVIPDDFRRLIHASKNLTLLVDESTACYPWEMAAQTTFLETSYLGTTMGLSRQFRTLLSPTPGSLPPLNRTLKVLVIADPATGRYSLPHAREEGLVVVDVLNRVRSEWDGKYEILATVRMGSQKNEAEIRPFLEKCNQLGDWINAQPCDPLELMRLIVNEHFDVIHFAGHGGLDPKRRRAGWVFDGDCFLSAQDIFRVRQVPRLVFANACFSAVTTDVREQRGSAVGLAQAFFARGIPNYIGTGWEVDDRIAEECARWFYTLVLGLKHPAEGDGIIGTSPPATIGEALLRARKEVFRIDPNSSTWGAYQHYGRISDKLLPLPNVSAESGSE